VGVYGRGALLIIVAVAPLAVARPASAQLGPDPSLSVEAGSDQRRRGLSWSDGEPMIEAYGAIGLSDRLEIGVGATTTRASRRHGGADAAVDLSARYRHDLGAWRLSAGVTGHVFAGAAGLDYAEIDGRLSYGIGPAQLRLGASYAPAQQAIGGDNLYLSAGVDVGLPGTPFSLTGHVGRSSGRIDDPLRAMRLRPEGGYRDYAVGVDYLTGPFAAGVRYSDTSIDAVDLAAPFVDRHVGSRVTGFLRVGF
jgi:uncharacterized protein (TIGR02001 family)